MNEFERGENRPPHVRWTIRRDMPEVLRIEAATNPQPWSEEDFLTCLRQRHCIGMVAEVGDKVLGFMIYELHKTKLHLVRFAGEGVKEALIEKLLKQLSSRQRSRITIVVPESDLDSLEFFRQRRFLATDMLWGEFEDTDGIRMEYVLDNAEVVEVEQEVEAPF